MALFHHYEDPQHAANKYLKQIPGTVTPYYQPYIDTGSQAMGNLQNQYGQMMGLYDPLSQAYMQSMQDPAAVLGGITSQYQTSPYEQYEQQNAMTSMNNAMQAGGMTGTPEHQTMAAQKSSDIANKYMQDYLKAALGIRSQGMAGTANLFGRGLAGESDLNKMGFQASGDLASALAQTLMQQSNLGYAGATNRNQHYAARQAMALQGLSNLGHGKGLINQSYGATFNKPSGGSGQQGGGAAGKAGMLAALMALL